MDIFCKVCVMVVSSVIGVGVGILCGVIVLKVFYSIRNFLYDHKEKVFFNFATTKDGCDCKSLK